VRDFATISERPSGGTLRLVSVAGPRLDPIALSGPEGALLGKDVSSRPRLEHPAVSRRHALVETRGGQWFVTDLGSRNGTFVNGRKLEPHAGVPLEHGDHVRVSPWVFRCILGPTVADAHTTEDRQGTASRVEALRGEPQIAPVHLTSIIKASAAIQGASGEADLWPTLLDWALALTGFQRGAVIREGRDASVVEVQCQRTRDGGEASGFAFSRTLVREASLGKPVHLCGDHGTPGSNSLLSMNVSEAVCVPLVVDAAVWGCMYLDSGGSSRPVAREAAQLCGMLGDIGSLALANVLRREMEGRFATLRRDAELAAQAQRLLLPPEHGELAGLEYAVRFQPGRTVSGDIIGVVEVGEGRAAAFLGDVTGKGFGAGLVMTVIQSYLSGSLARHADPAGAVHELNRHLAKRLPPGCFASLWLGVFDARERTVRVVDAGHGYAFHVGAGGVAPLSSVKGTWLGVDAQTQYESSVVRLEPGDRVLVCSDGVAEQPGVDGAAFGTERVTQVAAACRAVTEDVAQLAAAVGTFAGTESFQDDLTIGSFALR
jgi:phosphoserine phosphatase RsbU/P